MPLCKEGNYFKIWKHDCEDRKKNPKAKTIFIPFGTIFFLYSDIPNAACHSNKDNICLIAGFKETNKSDNIMKLSSSEIKNANKKIFFTM